MPPAPVYITLPPFSFSPFSPPPPRPPFPVHGQYEELRFIFLTSLLPSDYKSSSFRRALQEELKSAVYTNYLADFHNILVEVEGSGVMNSTNSTSELTVRSVQNEVLYVDLNILPETLQPEDIQAIKDVRRERETREA